MIQIILSGLAMGLLGSIHCIGMCGPLALSLPLNHTGTLSRISPTLLYNIGRATTYSAMGVLLGWTGSRLEVMGYQQIFSIILGIAVLLFLLVGKYLPTIGFVSRFQTQLKKYLSYFLSRKNNAGSLFVFGLLNGLLPCGLVYMAIASALIIGSAPQSGLFMAAFGLGTLPLMSVLMLTGHYLSFSVKTRLKKAVPFFIAGVAILMILRGLNLGIPYISPAFHNVPNAMHCTPISQ